jgi:hypothetical protein
MNPQPELRTGPYLSPQARDLNAMSLPELDAYLEEVFRLDAEYDPPPLGKIAQAADGHKLESAVAAPRQTG